TAPYQYDSRAPTLEAQARGALLEHSQMDHEPSPEVLEQIAAYQRTVFSSPEARKLAGTLAGGQTPPPLDLHFPPGSDEAQGQALFTSICGKCHGGPTTDVIPTQAVHDSFFPVLNPDGTITVSGFLPNGIALSTNFNHDLPDHHDLNLGVAAIDMLEQLGVPLLPNPLGLPLPEYRIRFYTDATRTQKLMDMPPPVPLI